MLNDLIIYSNRLRHHGLKYHQILTSLVSFCSHFLVTLSYAWHVVKLNKMCSYFPPSLYVSQMNNVTGQCPDNAEFSWNLSVNASLLKHDDGGRSLGHHYSTAAAAPAVVWQTLLSHVLDSSVSHVLLQWWLQQCILFSWRSDGDLTVSHSPSSLRLPPPPRNQKYK